MIALFSFLLSFLFLLYQFNKLSFILFRRNFDFVFTLGFPLTCGSAVILPLDAVYVAWIVHDGGGGTGGPGRECSTVP